MQQNVLVLDWEIKYSKRRMTEQVTPKIKWWRLKEEHVNIQFWEKVFGERRLLDSVPEWWEENSTCDIESRTVGAWYVHRKNTSWG